MPSKCLQSSPGVELVAMGDMFQDRLDNCRKSLTAKMPDKVKVTDGMCFVGGTRIRRCLRRMWTW